MLHLVLYNSANLTPDMEQRYVWPFLKENETTATSLRVLESDRQPWFNFINNIENVAVPPDMTFYLAFSLCFVTVQVLMGCIVGLQWIKEIQWSFANE